MAQFDEIPSTEQGLKNYIMYCKRGIKECDLKQKRLAENMSEATIRLEKLEGKMTKAS